jgi:hypothetical protein
VILDNVMGQINPIYGYNYIFIIRTVTEHSYRHHEQDEAYLYLCRDSVYTPSFVSTQETLKPSQLQSAALYQAFSTPF